MTAKKKLLIKANGIANARKTGVISGVGRSTHKLLSALNEIEDLPFDVEVYVDGTSAIGFDFYGWKFKHSIFPIPVRWGNELTNIEPLYRKYCKRYDLLHIPHNDDWIWKGERFVVTMHDVFEYDAAVANGNTAVKEKWETMAYESVGIMTCSNYSKNEILKRFNIPEDKITVVYWGTATDIFYVENSETVQSRLKELGITGKYFVSISCAHPRKNVRTLMKAYREFLVSNPEHKLVMVWNNFPEELQNEYEAEIKAGMIIVLGSVSDDDLRILYNGASCTMFPTRSEGFGFPILESFACGTPIMTCRNTCLEEVGQDVAIYVGEDDTHAMADVMNMFENEKYDGIQFENSRWKILNKFTWQNTARKYIDFYIKRLV